MFSFFLRSKLVTTNFLQFIKFLSRTQSLFFEGENRKLSPGAVRLYYVRSEPGVHIHTPAGRIYRAMQPAAYQRIVTPYMPDSAGSGKSSRKTGHKKSSKASCLTDFFCTPQRADGSDPAGTVRLACDYSLLFIDRQQNCAHGIWRRCFRTLGATSQYPPGGSHPPPSYAHPGSAPHIPE